MHRHCCHYRHCCFPSRTGTTGPEELPGDLLTVSIGLPLRGAVVVRAVGEIDMVTAPDWAEALCEAVDLVAPDPDGPVGSGPPTGPEVVCDLDAVRFFAAAGVSALLAADEYAGAAGVAMVVVATAGPCGVMLDLTGVGRELRHRRSLTDPDPVAARGPAARPIGPEGRFPPDPRRGRPAR